MHDLGCLKRQKLRSWVKRARPVLRRWKRPVPWRTGL